MKRLWIRWTLNTDLEVVQDVLFRCLEKRRGDDPRGVEVDTLGRANDAAYVLELGAELGRVGDVDRKRLDVDFSINNGGLNRGLVLGELGRVPCHQRNLVEPLARVLDGDVSADARPGANQHKRSVGSVGHCFGVEFSSCIASQRAANVDGPLYKKAGTAVSLYHGVAMPERCSRGCVQGRLDSHQTGAGAGADADAESSLTGIFLAVWLVRGIMYEVIVR